MASWNMVDGISAVTLRGDYLRNATGIEDKNFDEPGFLNLLFAGIVAEQFGFAASSTNEVKRLSEELKDEEYLFIKDTGFPIQGIYHDELVAIYWPNFVVGFEDYAYKYSNQKIYYIGTPTCALKIANLILKKHPEYAETYNFVMPHFAEIARKTRKEYNCPEVSSFLN